MIVAFDGRNDGYLCWTTVAESGVVDSTQTTLIPLHMAHTIDRIAGSELPEFPKLPSLDHTGKIERSSPLEMPAFEANGNLEGVGCLYIAGAECAEAIESACALQPLEVHFGDGDCVDSEPCTELQSPESPTMAGWNPFSSPRRDLTGHEENMELAGHEEAVRQCRITATLVALARPLGAIRSWVQTFSHNLDTSLWLADLRDRQYWWEFDVVPDVAGEAAVDTSPAPGDRPRVAARDMRITIPIVKPPSWLEVQSIADRMPVVFDERGVKETMTVKMSRWDAFVDRQKEKLGNEVEEMQAARARDLEHADVDSEEPESEQPPLEDDIVELQGLVERMDDWKDLSRYSGKSISMASTWRGNEMKIHVLAFAEKDDESGVDFVRLLYKKSIEVRRRNCIKGSGPTLASALSGCANCKEGAEEDAADASEKHWIELLKQPDVAKFAIALAFRDALERDGVHLEFCDAQLDADGH